MQKVLLAAAIVLGGLITYVDTRPTWDDTGITAAALLVISSVLGFLGPDRPWLWALALGIWIPIVGVVRTQNYWTIVALVLAFLGAYTGVAVRTWVSAIRH